jgi:hypothetical protein
MQHPMLQDATEEQTILRECDAAEERLYIYWRQRSRL